MPRPIKGHLCHPALEAIGGAEHGRRRVDGRGRGGMFVGEAKNPNIPEEATGINGISGRWDDERGGTTTQVHESARIRCLYKASMYIHTSKYPLMTKLTDSCNSTCIVT